MSRKLVSAAFLVCLFVIGIIILTSWLKLVCIGGAVLYAIVFFKQKKKKSVF